MANIQRSKSITYVEVWSDFLGKIFESRNEDAYISMYHNANNQVEINVGYGKENISMSLEEFYRFIDVNHALLGYLDKLNES